MKIPPQPISWLKGDPRWSLLSPFASYAPVVVILLFVICMVQIALGAYWIASMPGELSFALVLQPLVLPCMSLFNTVPSAHLHLWTKTNNPLLALWFSTILAVCYFASFLISISACASSPPSLPALCARGAGTSGPKISQQFWGANVGLWMLSFSGYTAVSAMAAVVWVGFRKREKEGPGRDTAAGEEGRAVVRTRGIGEGRRVRDWEEEMLTEEQRAERLKEASERWRRIQDL